MMYNPEYTREFYNSYGGNEWNRLEKTAYGRLWAIIHEDFLLRYLQPGFKVLDAGSGPGRFSIIAAKNGAQVTVLDISDTQLALAKEKISEAGQSVERLIRGDIADLSVLDGNSFDITICFGGALSYVCEKRFAAAGELVRVTKPGGKILVSVMSHMGALLSPVNYLEMEMLENPGSEVSGIPAFWPVVETGDLPAYPSGKSAINHAPMHLYTAAGLKDLFNGCTEMETAGVNVTIREAAKTGDRIAESPAAWETLVKLEKKINYNPGLVNSGSHILMALRKPRD